MRFFLITILVILCMAINVRIEGVWPPAAVNQIVEQTVRQVSEPAKSLRLLLVELLPSGGDHRLPSGIPKTAAMIHAVADSKKMPARSGLECG